jgi:hypothetical protein
MKACIESTFTLEEVAEHFERWRSNKRKGERIPEQLWSEAVDLVNSYGVSRVARTLRLGGRDLNQRRGMTEAARNEEATGGEPPFVEMDPVVMEQAVGPESAAVWMELERADGMRLRIHGTQGLEWLGLVERFMEARSCCS